MKKNNVIALLPMKGHSERLPNKNIKNIAGKPLCRWVLDTLLKVKDIDKVIINTDSEQIAKICQISDKVVIHNRPKSLCGDMVSMNKIIKHDTSLLEADIYLQTHATNPLLEPSTLARAITVYKSKLPKHDSLFSVTRLQTRLYNSIGQPINHDPKDLLRTQDLEPVYEENSNLYIFSRESFSKTNQRMGKNPYMFPIPTLEAVDIDELIDFDIADFLLRKQN